MDKSVTTFALVIATLALSVWSGAIVLQSTVVAPRVFRALDEASARVFLRALFPPFFRVGLICGLIATVALLPISVTAGWPGSLLAMISGAGLVAVLAGVSLSLVPAINAARDAGHAGARRFSRLHGISVLLTVTGLLAGLTMLGVVAGLAATALEL